MTTVVFLCCVSLVLFGTTVLAVIGRRQATRRARALEGAVMTAGSRAELQERRANEFFSIIQGLEGERDTWQKLYHESSRQSGVAQAWLLRDLSGIIQRANVFARELKKHGVKATEVIVDPALKELVAEFGEHHPGGYAADVPRAPGFEEAKRLEADRSAEKTIPAPPITLAP